jgi:hypothetical protein
MALETTIPIQGLWKFIRWLPGFILRWYFPPAKMAQLIYVDMLPRGDSAIVDLGESASFTLNLQVINLSPFSVELDRANFRFWAGGHMLNALILKRQIIAPGEITTLFMREVIPDGHANGIAKSLQVNQNNAAALDGNIEFNCKLHTFAKTVAFVNF